MTQFANVVLTIIGLVTLFGGIFLAGYAYGLIKCRKALKLLMDRGVLVRPEELMAKLARQNHPGPVFSSPVITGDATLETDVGLKAGHPGGYL